LSEAYYGPLGTEHDTIKGLYEGRPYEQKIKYQSFGPAYFICTIGEDGIFGTKDDVKPPYMTAIYSFPENSK